MWNITLDIKKAYYVGKSKLTERLQLYYTPNDLSITADGLLLSKAAELLQTTSYHGPLSHYLMHNYTYKCTTTNLKAPTIALHTKQPPDHKEHILSPSK